MITEAQCDEISTRTADHVLRQVKPILAAAVHREAAARARAAPGDGINPWDLFAGAASGAIVAAVELIWSVADPEKTTKRDLQAMFAAMAAEIVEAIQDPPGSFVLKVEAIERVVADQRQRMN